MTERDDCLVDVDEARAEIETLGFRRFGVAVCTETSTKSFGSAGTITRSTPVVITPRPRVTKLSAEKALFIMQASAAKGGLAIVPAYEITAITPKLDAIGYTLAELFAPQTATSKKRTLWLLWAEGGDDLLGVDIDHATAYVVTSFKQTALRLTFTVGLAETLT